MNNHIRWRVSAMSMTVAMLGSLLNSEAQAFSLGKITVLSSVGQPLRAEVAISDITPTEASSLKVGIASAASFIAAGLKLNGSVAAAEVSLQRRADGKAYLRLTSAFIMTEPFVDLLVEAKWSSGRTVREYTMFFDASGLGASTVIALIPAPISLPTIERVTSITPNSGRSDLAQAAAPERSSLIIAASSSDASKPAPTPQPSRDDVIKLDISAEEMAVQDKPINISLEPINVALNRINPDFLIDKNVNQIKSDAVLDLPISEIISVTSSRGATPATGVQSSEFNAFRHKLAENLLSTQPPKVKQEMDGKVQTEVADGATVISTKDKLTLSNSTVHDVAQNAAAEIMAGQRQEKQTVRHFAELLKNIRDLNNLTAASSTLVVANTIKRPLASDASSFPSNTEASTMAMASTSLQRVESAAMAAVIPVEVALPQKKSDSVLPLPEFLSTYELGYLLLIALGLAALALLLILVFWL